MPRCRGVPGPPPHPCQTDPAPPRPVPPTPRSGGRPDPQRRLAPQSHGLWRRWRALPSAAIPHTELNGVDLTLLSLHFRQRVSSSLKCRGDAHFLKGGLFVREVGLLLRGAGSGLPSAPRSTSGRLGQQQCGGPRLGGKHITNPLSQLVTGQGSTDPFSDSLRTTGPLSGQTNRTLKESPVRA